MIREQSTQMNIYESLYPLEFVKLDADLEKMDQILAKYPIFLKEFTALMAKRHENSKFLGRGSAPAEVLLRMLLLRRLYKWPLRDTIKYVNDSLSLRKFVRIYYESIPSYSTLCRYDNLVTEEFLERLNDAVVAIAKERKVTRGNKLRTDTTVVESNSHYPSDSRLLYDGVRVLGRLAKKCQEISTATGETVRDFSRSAKKQLLKVVKYAKGRCDESKSEFKRTYKKLVDISKRSLNRARKQVAALAKQTDKKALQIKDKIENFIPLIEKVIEQTQRRIFNGESVPNDEKIFSLFQPDIYCIRKGKSGKPNEFGKKVSIHQSDGKIITGWKIYERNVADEETFIPAIKQHIKQFGKPPHLAAGDRGCYSADNENDAEEFGVKRVCLPKRGKKSQERTEYEKQRWFKAGCRFRAGSEGSISVLKRRHGLDRCLNKAENAFERWIGWAVIGANLLTIVNV